MRVPFSDPSIDPVPAAGSPLPCPSPHGCGSPVVPRSVPRAAWRSSSQARFRNLWRSEEHTSELQSRPHLVCRLLLEKKKKILSSKYFTALPQIRASEASREHTVCGNGLLPKLPPGITVTTLSLCDATPSDSSITLQL